MSKLMIVKQFEFACSHTLPHHEGACQRLHGHNYRLEVGVSGPLLDFGPSQGMVTDFSDLKTLVKNRVVDILDHRHLNHLEIPGLSENPTAENMVNWIVQVLQKALHSTSPADLALVRLWETSTSYCEWRA